MRIDVLNTMVVLVLRYIYYVESYWQKLRMSALPVRRIFSILTPQNPLNLNLGARNLHRAENSKGPNNPPNLVFLGAPRANCQGVVSPPPLGRPRYEKGLADRPPPRRSRKLTRAALGGEGKYYHPSRFS